MKMAEIHADIQQFVRPLPLEEYRQRVGHHLDLIEAGAEMTVRHVLALDRRPAFDTRAQAELDHAERVIETALLKIRSAKKSYAGKAAEVA